MKNLFKVVFLLNLFGFLSLYACTTMIITKGASKDGSVFVAHSDDSEMFDNRLVKVPAKDYKVGSLRAVYYDASALGNRPEFNANVLQRYVGEDRGEVYKDRSKPQSIPLGFIPQVAHTYAYYEGNYGMMNEHQLMFGEATNGAKVTAEPKPGKLLFYSAELSRVALERTKTAKEAIKLIGHLIDTYGYYGTGETLPVADKNEGWVIEMAPSPEGKGGLWVAKRVPDGEVFVAANEFRIREVETDSPDMIYSKNLHSIAQKHGWWNPKDGKLDWLKTVSEGEYSHPYYSLRRVWRVQDKLAPSMKLSPWVKNGYTKHYPFSIKPDKKLGVRDVISLYRDYYQGTEFDQSKGVTAGPFGNPYRYPGPMDAGNDTGDPNAKLQGAWERSLSIYRSGYSFVLQARSWLPDAIGGVVWFGPDEPMSTVITPFYVGADSIPKSYYTGFSDKFDQKSAWWAFNFVANWAGLKYSYIIEDIKHKQNELEYAQVQSLKDIDAKALKVYKKSPQKAKKILTEYSNTQANKVVDEWWSLAWRLVAKYSDGYVNEHGKMAQEVGYPKEWYEKSEWKNGPTKYEKPRKKVTKDLILLLKKNSELKKLLVASIAKAKKANPDVKSNPVRNLDDYYDFIDSSVELLPNEILKGPSSSVRDQMLQGICYFYYLLDQPLDELKGKGLYRNSLQYYPAFSTWLVEFSKSWGAYLDTPASWSSELYKELYKDPIFNLDKGWYESESNWKTFNDFFAKYLKSKDVRPIASIADSSVVTLPADSVPQGVWKVDKESNIRVEDGLSVKLATYYNVGDLLGKDSKYKDAFANGVLTHTFLNVNDYHRFHFPVGGVVKEKSVITKNVALEVSWDKSSGKYIPIDSTGWQFTQTRGCVVVDTKEYGLVALIPMGMAQVSSVVFESDVKIGSTHKKGDMLGNFYFGGSDFIVLFQKRANFKMTTKVNKHALMGQEYGKMSK
ncbi:MAG: C69 family dipeptidase [Campylobacterota bacterium]|nr:C69 family dipeptidase [Campylobacterota bacterium]